MRDIFEIIKAHEAAKKKHHESADTLPAPALRALHDEVKAISAEMAATITDGAEPCPSCGAQPHGMLQADRSGAGAVLFEVGCTSCGWFLHSDGAPRDHGAVAGMPRHAVEQWNAGPSFWKKCRVGDGPADRFTAAEAAALLPLKRHK